MSLTPSQKRALADLLQDTDPSTVNLVKRELLQAGPNRLPHYRRWADELGDIPGRHLRDVIGRLEDAEHQQMVAWMLAELQFPQELEFLSWELARADDPTFHSAKHRAQLDEWAETLHPLIATCKNSEEQIRTLAEFMHHRQGFVGNAEDYYNPSNVYLHKVIDTRRGMPLTLCLVYALIGWRIGLKIEGISAPGHFLLRLDGVIFDPYFEGKIVSATEWEALLAEVPALQMDLVRDACSPLHWAHRLLINLRNAYAKQHDFAREKRVEQYLAVLQR